MRQRSATVDVADSC